MGGVGRVVRTVVFVRSRMLNVAARAAPAPGANAGGQRPSVGIGATK
jgi:hypothetical protein